MGHMKKNKCQAYTKEKKPCKNYAMKGSQFCSIHKGLFEDFPPVKITALICPYCDKPLKRGTKFCKFCKNSLNICPYCSEPLKKDDKFCSFCKEDLVPSKPKPEKPNYYAKLINIRNRFALKDMSISYGCLVIIFFLLLILFVSVYMADVYFRLTNS